MRKVCNFSIFPFLLLLSVSQESFAQPCYSGYNYRVPIMIDNSSNAKMSDQQVELIFNTASLVSQGKMNSDGSDIRVLDRYGDSLSFYIERGTMNSLSTTVWVKTKQITGYYVDTIYLFYGKTGSTNQSNAATTFPFFDDFNGGILGSQWTTCGVGTAAVSSGELSLTASSIDKITIEATPTIEGSFWLETKVSGHTGGESVIGVINSTGNGYNAILDGSSLSLAQMSSVNCFSYTRFGTASTTTKINGTWQFAWKDVGRQEVIWPGGSITGGGNTYSTSTNSSISLGKAKGGTLKLDWVRVRKVPTGNYSLTIGSEVAMNYSIQASYDSPLCEGGDLKLRVNSVVGARYRWTGPNGFSSRVQNPILKSVSVSDTGYYAAYAEIPSGCSVRMSVIKVSISKKAEGGSVVGSATACGNANQGVLTLQGQIGTILRWESSNSEMGPWSPLGNTTSDQPYKNLKKTTLYRAVVANPNCPNETSSMGKISVDTPSMSGQLIGGGTLCKGRNSSTIELVNNIGKVEKWEQAQTIAGPWVDLQNSSANYTILNLTSQRYYRAIVKNGVCPNDTSNVVVYRMNPNPVAEFEISDSCYGALATFNDKSSIVNGGIIEFLWTFSDGFTSTQPTFRKSLSNPGEMVLTLEVKSDSGCVGTATKKISVWDAPLANFRIESRLGDGALCTNDTLALFNSSQSSGTNNTLILWNFGDSSTSAEQAPRKVYAKPGTYPIKLMASSPFGCRDSITRSVTVFQHRSVSAGIDAQVSKGIPFQLTGHGVTTYYWSPEDKLNDPSRPNPTATINEPTTFVVHGTDEYGCVSLDSAKFTVASDYKIIPNNVITPEGNNENDTWVVKNINTYPNNTVSVFDRWGRMVFSADNYQNDWGATNINGTLLIDGTYYYVIEFKDVNEVYKGAITVIRNQNR